MCIDLQGYKWHPADAYFISLHEQKQTCNDLISQYLDTVKPKYESSPGTQTINRKRVLHSVTICSLLGKTTKNLFVFF